MRHRIVWYMVPKFQNGFLSQYFRFPPSASFHQFSVLIHLPITATVQSHKLTALVHRQISYLKPVPAKHMPVASSLHTNISFRNALGKVISSIKKLKFDILKYQLYVLAMLLHIASSVTVQLSMPRGPEVEKRDAFAFRKQPAI